MPRGMDGGREINSIPLNWGLKWGWAGGSEIERNGGNQPLPPILASPSPCNQFYCMCWTSCICPLESLSSLFHRALRPGRLATVDQIHELINLELLIMSANGEAQGGKEQPGSSLRGYLRLPVSLARSLLLSRWPAVHYPLLLGSRVSSLLPAWFWGW